MEKTRIIARFAIRICLFAAILSQGTKECVSQAFFSQDNALFSQEDYELPLDGLDLSQIQEIFMADDFVLSQDEEVSLEESASSSQEILSRQNSFDTRKICDNFIAIENVEVLVDNIREEHLERQIQEIVNTDLNAFIAKPKRNANEIEANIAVRQRSYYKNMKRRNSIYVYYSIFEKNGKRLAENWFSAEGKASIISSAIQARQIKKAVRGMKRQIRKYNGKSKKDENKQF